MAHRFVSKNYGTGKIVRDLIPTDNRLGPDEREAGLRVKIREELDELLVEENSDKQLLEEAADVFEAVNALLEVRGLNIDQVADLAEAKRKEKGAFKDCQFLPDTVQPIPVYTREECIFNYCDAPAECKPAEKCRHT